MVGVSCASGCDAGMMRRWLRPSCALKSSSTHWRWAAETPWRRAGDGLWSPTLSTACRGWWLWTSTFGTRTWPGATVFWTPFCRQLTQLVAKDRCGLTAAVHVTGWYGLAWRVECEQRVPCLRQFVGNLHRACMYVCARWLMTADRFFGQISVCGRCHRWLHCQRTYKLEREQVVCRSKW